MNSTDRQAELTQEFIKLFDELSHTRNRATAYSDWTEMVACAIHQAPYHNFLLAHDDDFERIEAMYMSVVKRYTKAELNIFTKLFGITQLAFINAPFSDFLGPIYMKMGLGEPSRGEFFTPEHVSELMAKMTLGSVGDAIKEKGHVTVSDPCIGAGVMLIKAAQEVERQGYKRWQMLFHAADLARDSFNSAYIQLSIMGLLGTVEHANSLSSETFEQRKTPALKVAMQK